MKRFVVLLALCALAMAAISIGGCDKLKDIKGNLAGQVVTAEGFGVGYMSVALYNSESGKEVDRQNAADSGNFFFRDVKSGTYNLKLFDISGNEIPTDTSSVKLGTGRTKTITVTMLPPAESAE